MALPACSSSDRAIKAKIQEQNATNIQKVANLYRLYAFVNGHRGPASIEELKQFLKSNKAITPNLELIGIDLANLDSYFMSEADSEEFAFRWDVRIKPELEIAPIVFEKTGAKGMRRIALACDVVLEVTDDKLYDRLFDGKIKKSDVPAYVFGTGDVTD